MATYNVTIPIAGHALLTVEAGSEEEAIQKAIDEATLDNVQEWEAIKQFHKGNVCYCPHPWEAEAQLDD